MKVIYLKEIVSAEVEHTLCVPDDYTEEQLTQDLINANESPEEMPYWKESSLGGLDNYDIYVDPIFSYCYPGEKFVELKLKDTSKRYIICLYWDYGMVGREYEVLPNVYKTLEDAQAAARRLCTSEMENYKDNLEEGDPEEAELSEGNYGCSLSHPYDCNTFEATIFEIKL